MSKVTMAAKLEEYQCPRCDTPFYVNEFDGPAETCAFCGEGNLQHTKDHIVEFHPPQRKG